jgi:hypothetical protein
MAFPPSFESVFLVGFHRGGASDLTTSGLRHQSRAAWKGTEATSRFRQFIEPVRGYLTVDHYRLGVGEPDISAVYPDWHPARAEGLIPLPRSQGVALSAISLASTLGCLARMSASPIPEPVFGRPPVSFPPAGIVPA